MRSTLKKMIAGLLALTMCLSFAGCYDENKTWAAKKGDDTMPIGGYIYYLYSALGEASSKVSSDQEILKATIEDKDAKTWIKDKALTQLKAYYYISDLFTELGLELTEEDTTSIEDTTTSMWSYYQTTMEDMGIAQDSFNKAYSEYSVKYQKVFETMYGEGGEKAVSDDELKTYFTDNYYSYEYFTAPLTKADDSGNSVAMTDEEKTEVENAMSEYVDKINNGSMSVSEAASEYAEKTEGDSTYTAPVPTTENSINSDIFTALESAKDNEAVFMETDTTCYVIRRLPIADGFDSFVGDSTQKWSLISSMKADEFQDYVMEQAANVSDVTINEAALNSISVSSLVNDTNKNGTSSASSEEETSSTASEESSAVSSEVSSEAAE
jgi:hypothetical protein